jgi:rubrerythrin
VPPVDGSETHKNLLAAFADESQANRRYLWFAEQADVEGYPDIAAVFRSVAELDTGHAHGLLEYLAEVGDPATGQPIGDAEDNLKSAIASEMVEASTTYPAYAATARAEGFDEVAEWFETLAKAENRNVDRLREGLENLR